jgi:hypothetical protein
MKKPTRKRPQLVLAKETLKQLSDRQLTNVAGAGVTGDPCFEPPEITYA